MRKKLLLVEDNPAHEELTRLALRKTGFDHELIVLRDGIELLEYLFRQERYVHLTRLDMPDLILLDLKLPRMNGLEVLAKLKTDGRTRYIPIIMLSSSTEHHDIMQSYKLGANSYIHKRMNAEEFNTVLGDILSYWFSFVKLPPRVYLDKSAPMALQEL
jgi:two-component system response regulator